MANPLTSIAPGVRISKNVTIQPFAYIEDNVEIGDGCIIISYVSILNGTQLRGGNKMHQCAVLETEPQDFRYKGGENSLIIGDNNCIRKSVVISRATSGGNATEISNGNFLMDKTHVCHSVQTGDNCVTDIGTTITRERVLSGCIILSGNVTLHQYCHVE